MIRRQQSLYADQDQLKESYARKIAANLGFNDPYDIKLFYHDNQDLIEKYFKGGGLLIHLENSTPLKFRLSTAATPGKTVRAIPKRLFGHEILNHSDPTKPRTHDETGVTS